MIRHIRLLGILLALMVGYTAQPVFAQAPKVGKFYEDAVDLGFKIKMPKDWEYTPPQPDETTMVGKYTPTYNKYINLTPDDVLWLEAYLIKFDRRKKADDDETEDEFGRPKKPRKAKSSEAQLKAFLTDHYRGKSFKIVKQKELKVNKVKATEYLFVGQKNGNDFNVYAVLYHLLDDVDVAVTFNGPADKKKWRKYESAMKKMGKSFKPIEVEQIEAIGAKEGDSAVRTLKRSKLQADVAKNPGWELYETDNYFVITDNDDKAFIKELMIRLEAIRAVYEVLYPWSRAESLRAVAAQNRKERDAEEKRKRKEDGEEEEEDEEGPDPTRGRSTTTVSSRELSRCSVVRIFKNRSQYMEYGAPGGSAGYWSSYHEELVIYDDQAGGGRNDTWIVLNHEAFHQYIFYLYGSISPHSWYNEGTGDYFSGYEYKHKKFKLKPNSWRKETIKTAIKAGKTVPLKDLVRFSQREYYGSNDFGAGPGQNYAQGWSFIYFLRTGKGKAPGWDSNWEGILDVYFETLASTEDLEEAVDTAFAGVDWDAMETSWQAYTLKGK